MDHWSRDSVLNDFPVPSGVDVLQVDRYTRGVICSWPHHPLHVLAVQCFAATVPDSNTAWQEALNCARKFNELSIWRAILNFPRHVWATLSLLKDSVKGPIDHRGVKTSQWSWLTTKVLLVKKSVGENNKSACETQHMLVTNHGWM